MKPLRHDGDPAAPDAATCWRYVGDPNFCIYCGSKDISAASHIEAEADSAWQGVQCCSCGEEWTDVYTLTGVTNKEGWVLV